MTLIAKDASHASAQYDRGYSRLTPVFHVLVVDDEPLFLRLVSATLGPQGFLVHTCSCGASALDFISNNSDVTLVLLDISIPEPNGFQVLDKLNKIKHRKGFRVCMVSGRSDPFAISRALASGADDYFVKGLYADILIAKVRSLIEAEEYHTFFQPIHPAFGLTSWHRERGQELELKLQGVSSLGLLLLSPVAWSLHSHFKASCETLQQACGFSEELLLKVKQTNLTGSNSFEIATEIIGLSPDLCRKLQDLAEKFAPGDDSPLH